MRPSVFYWAPESLIGASHRLVAAQRCSLGPNVTSCGQASLLFEAFSSRLEHSADTDGNQEGAKEIGSSSWAD